MMTLWGRDFWKMMMDKETGGFETWESLRGKS
jgi:hypothetical protein